MISDGKFLRLKKRTFFVFFPLFSLLLFLTSAVFCQDSLYLIGTITGESNGKRITNVKGIGDVNGDGYADFMVATADKTVRLYLGSPNLNLTPSVVFHYPGKDSLYGFGGCAGIGDVNGDGYNDFIIMGSFGDWGSTKGKVFLYYGGLKIDTIPKYEFYEPWIQDYFGFDIEGVGDINKDGYDDFTVSSPYNWTDGIARVYLFWGGDTISFARSVVFSDSALGYFGTSVANIGDINGDGFDDLAIGAPLKNPGKVYVYYGGKTMDTIPDTVLTSNNLDYNFGRIIKRAGDINKNGKTNFCIAGGENIFVYNGFSEPIVIKGYSLGAGGDINHDGYDDLIVGNNWKIKAYLGSDKFDTTNQLIIEPQDSLGFSGNISIGGDINKDGYDEVFAHSINWPEIENPLGKIYIYSYKKFTDVKESKQTTPIKFNLYQNYPNPFNPNTAIRYQLSITSYVDLKVYDVLGRVVKTLVDGIQKPGEHTINFDGSRLSSGVYFYRLTAGQYITQKSMLLLK